ncbi:hypothetical protein ACFL3C_00810 [Patescibacteria group bacterium]
MIKPELTLQEAESELGDMKQVTALEITSDDLVVSLYKETCAIADEALRSGVAVHTNNLLEEDIRFNDIPGGLMAKEKLGIVNENLGRLVALRLYLPIRQWYEMLDENQKHHQERFPRLVLEFLYNAIEHGSDYCATGSIIVNAKVGVDCVLCSIEQPNSAAVLIEKITQLMSGEINRDKLLQPNEAGRQRGRGLYNASFDFYPQLGVESLESGGARIIIFETKQRLAELDEKQRRLYEAEEAFFRGR